VTIKTPTTPKTIKEKFLFAILGVAALISLIGCNEDPIAVEVAMADTPGNLYMDVHRNIEGLTAEGVAGAHQKDLEIQGQYGVDYQKYWFDEESGSVFCLVKAPSAELASRVHEEAHGLVADEITLVAEGH
jgi:hypothetical protein